MLGRSQVMLRQWSEIRVYWIQWKANQNAHRSDLGNVREVKPRMYATRNENQCPVHIFKKYSDKRPSHMLSDDSPFYLVPVTDNKMPAKGDRWFISQPIGVNKLNSLLRCMAEKAGLHDLAFKHLTNTSVRKHLCQKLLRHSGHPCGRTQQPSISE
jgi:hypothetical protein